MYYSDGSMDTHDEMEDILNADEELLPIINVEVEFSLDGIVDKYACSDTNLIIFTVPVCLVSDRHTLPSVWIN